MAATRRTDDEEATRTALTLLRGGIWLLAVTLVASVVLQPLPLMGHVTYASILGLHGVTLALVRRGRRRLAVAVFASLCIAIVVATMLGRGGVRAPAAFVLPAIVLFVGLTAGGRSAVLAAVASSLAILVVVVLERQGRLPPRGDADPARIWLVMTTVLTVTGLMLVVALRVIRESRARAAAHEEARRALEEHLQQVRRLEAVGRLAAGVAHDFNNVLTVVFAEAHRLQRIGGAAAPSAAYLQEAAERASALTRQLLAFGRRQLVEPELLDLDQVIEGLRPLLARFVGDSIRFEVELAGGLDSIRADRTQVEQVLLNLVTNARDAMPEGGRLTVRTGAASPSAVFVEVRDTGAGIPDEVRDHLFEPFFTTKPSGHGTGLGLATVHGIVRQWGGEVVVDSVAGYGSTFTVRVPIAEARHAEAAAAPARPARAAGAEIVVVDDDAMSRAAIETLLADTGHRVTSLRGAAETLAAAPSWTTPPDLILTDVIMPDVSGMTMAQRLRERFPTLKFLFMSGYAEDQLSERGALAAGVHFIAKPLRRDALLAKIDAVLASPEIGAVGVTPAAAPEVAV